jgi:diguanylate cyclase (GGDEF)-like protein
LALSYRDASYAWYALYMLLAILAATSYLGLASYALWPDATRWPEYSILFLIQAAATTQLWFCQLIFLRQGQMRRLRKMVYMVTALSIALGVVYFFLPQAMQRMMIFTIGLLMCIAMVFFIVGLTLWRTRQQATYFWVVAYVPLIVIVVVSLLRQFNWVTGFELPFELPVYALAFEAVVLLAALHLHAKERHAFEEREKAIAALDPLTGFFNANTFQQQLQQLWQRSLQQQEDLALALVQVQHSTDRTDSQSAVKLERKLLRSVRLLRAITRDVDVVGRIGGNTLAVAMPGIPMGDELNNRLARLVAQGLMRDAYDEQSSELRFRIAAGTRLSYGDNLSALDNNLRFEISQSSGWSRKPIHYISLATVPGELSQPARGKADSGLQGSPDPAALSSDRSSGRGSMPSSGSVSTR